MRIFKYRHFKRWAKDEDITDQTLIDTANEIKAGLVDANLGGGLYKKRVPREGQGKRGGYRVLLAYKQDKHVFFLYGFAKNEKDNINDEQKGAFLDLAKYFLTVNEQEIAELVKINELVEINYGEE